MGAPKSFRRSTREDSQGFVAARRGRKSLGRTIGQKSLGNGPIVILSNIYRIFGKYSVNLRWAHSSLRWYLFLSILIYIGRKILSGILYFSGHSKVKIWGCGLSSLLSLSVCTYLHRSQDTIWNSLLWWAQQSKDLVM